MHDLNSTAGAVALAAAGLGLLALLLGLVLLVRLRALRADQRVILGERREDLVGHAAGLSARFRELGSYVEDVAASLERRAEEVEGRLDHAIAYRSVVRYDAYGEMSGRQSTSIALLDATGSGVILSSIHHRDSARLYTKQVRAGAPEIELSPEEEEAVRIALDGEAPAAGDAGGTGAPGPA